MIRFVTDGHYSALDFVVILREWHTMRLSVSIIIFVLSLFQTGAPPVPAAANTNVCEVSLTQVLRIPVTMQAEHTPEHASGDAPTLMVSPGATDELPDGPASFDVLDDGSVLITDPLRNRVAVFDAQGKFRKSWKIGFAADHIVVVPGGFVLIQEAATGQVHVFDRDGQPRPAEPASLPQRPAARVLSGTNGAVERSGGNPPIQIAFDRPGLTLLSIEYLAGDRDGNTYVALETTASGGAMEQIDLNKYVRKYGKDGALLGEISDIPLDYYVTPVDELRVHKGTVYQLLTTRTEVKINQWNTNQHCSHP